VSHPIERVMLAVAALNASCGLDEAPRATHDRIFVSQAGSATIAVIDADTGAVEAHLEVGMLPHNLVVSPDGRTLYAGIVGSQAIAEIDVATARLRRTMLTAPVPAVRADGSVIQPHVDQRAAGHTTCYDCHRPGGALPKYAGNRPFGLLLSPDGGQLLVSHLRSADIAVLDLATGQIEATVALEPAGPATEAVALARLDDEIWVALRPPQPSLFAGALRRLDATTLAPRIPLGDVATGSDPASLLAMPARSSVLVANFEASSVTEHGRAGAAIAHTAAPGPLGVTGLAEGQVLALDYYANAVSFLDLDTGVARTVALGAPYANPTHAALASDGRTAWIVIGSTDGHLVQLDLASAQIMRDIAIDGLSFGIAVVSAPVR
jgi:DNA-binding beta-propeller fold protein YncE